MTEVDLTKKKSMYELWRDGELPEPYQSDIDGFSSEGKSQPERLFRAGFLCYKKLNEIMEARKIKKNS